MAKKALSSKFIWGIYVPLGIMILGVILDRSILQFNLWKLLANIGKGIYHIKIPDFFHVILIIAIFISLVFINKKYQRLSPNKFKEMLADNERIKNHNESLIKSANNIIAVNEELKTEIEKIRRENKADIEKAKKELLQMFKERENETKKEKNELRKRLELKESVVFEHDACWEKDKEGNIVGGPYCSKCYDSERKLMNLISCGDAKYSECPICKKPLRIKYREPWKPSKIENEGTPFDDEY